jgi:hypothetical protein
VVAAPSFGRLFSITALRIEAQLELEMRKPLRRHGPSVLKQHSLLPQLGLGEEGARTHAARADLSQAAIQHGLHSGWDFGLSLAFPG